MYSSENHNHTIASMTEKCKICVILAPHGHAPKESCTLCPLDHEICTCLLLLRSNIPHTAVLATLNTYNLTELCILGLTRSQKMGRRRMSADKTLTHVPLLQSHVNRVIVQSAAPCVGNAPTTIYFGGFRNKCYD
jgi:hypothetical protein